MKTYQSFLFSLCFVFLCPATLVFSQDYKPLLCSDTLAAVHLNLKDFDFDRFTQGQVEQIDSIFEKLNYDDDSREAVCREAKTLISGKVNLLKPLYQVFIAGTKIDEIVVVSYSSGLKIAPALVATPLEGKTPNQIALIESFFKDAPFKPFQHEGFMILAVPLSPDKSTEAAEWMKKHISESSHPEWKILDDAFQGMTDDTILRGLIVKPNNIRELLDSVDATDFPQQLQVLIDIYLEKVQWVSFGVDPYRPHAVLAVQAAGESEAQELYELLKSSQDAGVEAMRLGLLAGIAQGSQENPALIAVTEFVPLLTEIARGAFRQTLPQVYNGTKLIFSTCL